MDDATLRLVVAIELAEAQSLKDDSNGTSDSAMARRFAIDQLLSCRALNQIEEMTDTQLARAILPPPLRTDTCTACGDSLEMDKAWQAPCKHWHCFDCLGTLVQACMDDETLYPPRCCDALPRQEIKELLPRDLATSFEQKAAEFDTPAGERLYCAQPACSNFLGSTTIFSSRATCSLCHSNTCTNCRAAFHAGPCPLKPSEAEQQTLQLAHEQGWQSCRQCKQIVDLIPGGCNHMTCRCGHQFCYVCGARWKTCHCPSVNDAIGGIGVVHPDIRAARDRYIEAVREVEGHVGRLREAERMVGQRLDDFLQIINARRAQ